MASEVFDPRWQQVTCKRCAREYQCTPETDYYFPPGAEPTAGEGFCFACLLANSGRPVPETVMVIYPSGPSQPEEP